MTLRRLRWSVAAETMIVLVVLAVTAVLVNTATARETFAPPASAAVAFNTGGPGGRGNVSITVTPAVLGPNQVRVSVTNSAGRPYSPRQIGVALLLPARHLGPLAVALKQDSAGRYASGPSRCPLPDNGSCKSPSVAMPSTRRPSPFPSLSTKNGVTAGDSPDPSCPQGPQRPRRSPAGIIAWRGLCPLKSSWSRCAAPVRLRRFERQSLAVPGG